MCCSMDDNDNEREWNDIGCRIVRDAVGRTRDNIEKSIIIALIIPMKMNCQEVNRFSDKFYIKL